MAPKYFNRRFESVPDERRASFVETAHEYCLDLRLSERDLGPALARYHFNRDHSQEARFSLGYANGMLVIGNLAFVPAGHDHMVARCPSGIEIIVGTHLFKADAETALSILAAHSVALYQAGVLSIALGVEDDPRYKGKRIGVCYPASGRVTFFCDEHGGLLAKGIADITQSDPHPVDFERTVLHGLAHLMEHDKKGSHSLSRSRSGSSRHGQSNRPRFTAITSPTTVAPCG